MIYWRTDAYITTPLTLFAYLVHKTNRFHITVGLFGYKSQKTSK